MRGREFFCGIQQDGDWDPQKTESGADIQVDLSLYPQLRGFCWSRPGAVSVMGGRYGEIRRTQNIAPIKRLMPTTRQTWLQRNERQHGCGRRIRDRRSLSIRCQ